MVQLTAVFTGEHQRVNFLPEGSALIGFSEFFDSGNQNSEEFQNSQQTQEPQEAQINRDEGLQEKRQDGNQVNDCERAADIAQT